MNEQFEILQSLIAQETCQFGSDASIGGLLLLLDVCEKFWRKVLVEFLFQAMQFGNEHVVIASRTGIFLQSIDEFQEGKRSRPWENFEECFERIAKATQSDAQLMKPLWIMRRAKLIDEKKNFG